MNLDFKLRVISPEIKLSSRFSQNMVIDGNFGVVHVVKDYDADPYTGPYEVTPTVEGEVLPTAQKLMKEDLTIKAIPVYVVSNTAGGNTVYIATMDDDPSGSNAILGKARLGHMVLGKGR